MDYQAQVEEVVERLSQDNHATAVALLSLPEQIRGYGHIKEAHLKSVEERRRELLNLLRNPTRRVAAA